MKLKYKYIHFEETSEIVGGKVVWVCKDNKRNDILSKIFYYKLWREYCFTQEQQDVIFDDGCLADIIDFIKQLNNNIGIIK